MRGTAVPIPFTLWEASNGYTGSHWDLYLTEFRGSPGKPGVATESIPALVYVPN